MPFRLQESSVRDAGAAMATAAAFIVGVRALAIAASVVLSRLSWLHGGLGQLLEVVAFLLTFFVFDVDSGLAVPTSLVSVAVALVVGWSLRSVRGILVSVFILVSVVSSPLLSRSVVVVVEDANVQGLWVSAFKGERAYFSPVVVGDCAAAAERQLFVYYDNVRLTEDHDLPASACSALHPPEALTRLLTAVRGRQKGEENASGAGIEESEGRATSQTPQLSQWVISIGERTRIDGFNGFTAEGEGEGEAQARWDTVVLLGDNSELRNTILHCRKHGASTELCLAAAHHTKLSNVTIRLYEEELHRLAAVVLVREARSCEDVRDQLADHLGMGGTAVAEQLVRCIQQERATSAANRFAELLYDKAADAYAPSAGDFLHNMPTLVAWRWYLPDVFRDIQDTLVYLADTVCTPLGAGAITLAETLAWVLRELGVWLGQQTAAAGPYVAEGGRQMQRGTLGLLCGDTQEPWLGSCVSHRCEPAFVVGAQVHDGVVAAAAATLDALELVPGVWGLVKWCWDAEWRVTAALVRGTARTAALAGSQVLGPLARGIYAAGEGILRVLPGCAGPLKTLGGLLRRSPAGHYVYVGFAWLYGEEVREMRLELAALHRLFTVMWDGTVVGACAAWRAAKGGVALTEVVMHWYMGTSFPIHLVVILAQTLLLFIAVRNEIKDLVERERREERLGLPPMLPASPLATGGFSIDSIAKSVTRRLRRSATVSRLSGIALFVRAHYYTCARYVVTHLVLIVVLVGLSVLPLMGRLYTLTLHFVLPWMSSEAFLSFFRRPQPSRREVAVLWMGRVVFAILLQRTLGDFLYRLVKDLLIAIGIFGAVVVVIWAWPRRGFLMRRVATVISESLNNTPIRAAPTPPQAPVLSPDGADEAASEDVARQVELDEAAVGGGPMAEEDLAHTPAAGALERVSSPVASHKTPDGGLAPFGDEEQRRRTPFPTAGGGAQEHTDTTEPSRPLSSHPPTPASSDGEATASDDATSEKWEAGASPTDGDTDRENVAAARQEEVEESASIRQDDILSSRSASTPPSSSAREDEEVANVESDATTPPLDETRE